MISAVIFDLDGVLVDSEYFSCAATADLLTARGIAMTEADVRRLFLGRPISAVYAHVLETTGSALHEGFAAEKEDLYFQRAGGELRAFAGALDVIERLRARRVPMAIASSGSPRKVAFSLSETGIGASFDVVCTTAEVTRGKPAPDLFLLAAEKLGVSPSDCAVVEDAAPGIEAARAAGAYAIGVTTSLDAERLRAAGAHHVIDAIGELPTVPALAGLFG